MTREKFQRKRYFFYEKDSRFNSRLIHKSSFLIGQVLIEKYWLKTLFFFAIQHIENRKRFTEVLSPRDQTNPFAYSCSFLHFTHHIIIGHGGWGGGERCQNAQLLFIIKTY